MNPRYINQQIIADLKLKMVFVAGPRQVGKTTLAEQLVGNEKRRILNWDFDSDRSSILLGKLPVTEGLLVFDELHKYRKWRNYLKGIFDKHKDKFSILVTGSARLDLFRKGGESLQGRYFLLRLHPLSVAELKLSTTKDFARLLTFGGFPEPYFSNNREFRDRWSITYRSLLVREDLSTLEQVQDLVPIELLAARLPELVGSPLSINALREDLQVAHRSVARWCEMLERLYYIFRLLPWGSAKIKAVKKEAKHYHFDWSLVEDAGARFENLVACHLLKWVHYLQDTKGREMELKYFRDRDGREVDFIILEKRKPILFVECKMSDKDTATSLIYLKRKYTEVRAIQVCEQAIESYQDRHGIEHRSALDFLGGLV